MGGREICFERYAATVQFPLVEVSDLQLTKSDWSLGMLLDSSLIPNFQTAISLNNVLHPPQLIGGQDPILLGNNWVSAVSILAASDWTTAT